jgi:hypothetical protein
LGIEYNKSIKNPECTYFNIFYTVIFGDWLAEKPLMKKTFVELGQYLLENAGEFTDRDQSEIRKQAKSNMRKLIRALNSMSKKKKLGFFLFLRKNISFFL